MSTNETKNKSKTERNRTRTRHRIRGYHRTGKQLVRLTGYRGVLV